MLVACGVSVTGLRSVRALATVIVSASRPGVQERIRRRCPQSFVIGREPAAFVRLRFNPTGIVSRALSSPKKPPVGRALATRSRRREISRSALAAL